MSIVTDSRDIYKFNGAKRRRRKCEKGHAWTTYEITKEHLAQSLEFNQRDAENIKSAMSIFNRMAKKLNKLSRFFEGDEDK
jgi:transcriptional regulator NrdR family protein